MKTQTDCEQLEKSNTQLRAEVERLRDEAMSGSCVRQSLLETLQSQNFNVAQLRAEVERLYELVKGRDL
jgi:cell division protein FtsB